MIIPGDYIVSGGYSYTNNSQTGTFIGEISVKNDRSFVGLVRDKGADLGIHEPRRLLFGTMDRDKMSFWKISSTLNASVIVYSLLKERDTYVGRWQYIEGITGHTITNLDECPTALPELAQTFHLEDRQVPIALGRINRERIRRYVRKRFLEEVVKNSIGLGYLRLEKMFALEA